MQSSEKSDFRDLVIAECEHVLPQCGLPIEPDPANVVILDDHVERTAASVNFGSETLRGGITVLLPDRLARSSYPLPLSEGLDGQLELFDWCGEIANRLVGRVKAGLAARGVEVEPSTPRTMKAEDVPSRPSPDNVCAVRFDCDEEAVVVLVDAVSSDGQLFRFPAEPSICQPEGELLLF